MYSCANNSIHWPLAHFHSAGLFNVLLGNVLYRSVSVPKSFINPSHYMKCPFSKHSVEIINIILTTFLSEALKSLVDVLIFFTRVHEYTLPPKYSTMECVTR